MKKFAPLSLILLILILAACSLTATPMTIVSDGTLPLGDCNGGILAGFKAAENICVTVVVKDLATMKTQMAIAAVNGPDESTNNAVAYVTADSVWINQAFVDKTRLAETYIPFAIDAAKADSLGWKSGTVHKLKDVVGLMTAKKLAPVVCHADQCSAGGMWFVTMLNGVKTTSNPTLSVEEVNSPDLVAKGKAFYDSGIRTAGSEKEAADIYFGDKANNLNVYDSIISDEVSLSALNARLVAAGKNPVRVFYLEDGTTISGITIAHPAKLSGEQLASFKKLVAYLLAKDAQTAIGNAGYRPATFGYPASDQVLRSDWGLSTSPSFGAQPVPVTAVMDKAIAAYSESYKPASDMRLCDDGSGSMDQNGGWKQVSQAILDLNDSKKAQAIWPSPRDTTTYYVFGADVKLAGVIKGNDPAKNAASAAVIANTRPNNNGNTAIYDCAIKALEDAVAAKKANPKLNQIIVILTDGINNYGQPQGAFIDKWNAAKKQEIIVPVYTIAYGDQARQEMADNVFGSKLGGKLFTPDTNDPNSIVKIFFAIKKGN